MDDEPQFSLDFSDLPDTEQKDTGPKERKVQSIKRELQEALKLQDDHEWIEWLRFDMVKPWWTELWAPLSKNNAKERGKGIGEIQNRILTGEAHDVLKYSKPHPKKDEWDDADHLARFHFNAKDINLRSQQGVFFSKNFTDEMMDRIVWALKGWLCKILARSYIDKVELQ
jgi:hypothetical protein